MLAGNCIKLIHPPINPSLQQHPTSASNITNMSSSSKPSKVADPKDSALVDKSKESQKQALSLEEDDEFEDFPVEGELRGLVGSAGM